MTSLTPGATATDTCTNDPKDEPDDETVNCVNTKADGNGPAGTGVAVDEEGLAIKQLSGPKVSTGILNESGGGGNETGGDGIEPTDGGPARPATGDGLGLLLLGAAAMPAAVLLARRRR